MRILKLEKCHDGYIIDIHPGIIIVEKDYLGDALLCFINGSFYPYKCKLKKVNIDKGLFYLEVYDASDRNN